jgi:transposase
MRSQGQRETSRKRSSVLKKSLCLAERWSNGTDTANIASSRPFSRHRRRHHLHHDGHQGAHSLYLEDLSLEELVPQENFYRRLQRTVVPSFVQELLRPCYASGGRPSIDPVVFFKPQLVMFFEGIRSERQPMSVAADRLSLRWYLGYDLREPLPEHSGLTKIRERYGLEVFGRFFEEIVELCVEAGLVWGEELYFDSTKVKANAAVDPSAPRWAVEAHLDRCTR